MIAAARRSIGIPACLWCLLSAAHLPGRWISANPRLVRWQLANASLRHAVMLVQFRCISNLHSRGFHRSRRESAGRPHPALFSPPSISQRRFTAAVIPQCTTTTPPTPDTLPIGLLSVYPAPVACWPQYAATDLPCVPFRRLLRPADLRILVRKPHLLSHTCTLGTSFSRRDLNTLRKD